MSAERTPTLRLHEIVIASSRLDMLLWLAKLTDRRTLRLTWHLIECIPIAGCKWYREARHSVERLLIRLPHEFGIRRRQELFPKSSPDSCKPTGAAITHAVIETARTRLRRFRLSDAEAVLNFGSNEQVLRRTGDQALSNIEDAEKVISEVWESDYQRFGYGRFGYGRLAVVLKSIDQVIGFAGLKYLPELNETDLGYRILPEHWGKGITSEMIPPVLSYGFEDLGLERIVAHVMPENLASSRVLEKSGFQFVKQAPYPGENVVVKWYSIANADSAAEPSE